MSIQDGAQILPTEGFDFSDNTPKEDAEYEDQINDEQELNDKNTSVLEDENGGKGVEDTSEEGSDDTDSDDSDDSADLNDSKSKESDANGEQDSSEEADTEEGKEEKTEVDKDAEKVIDKEVETERVNKREKFEKYSRNVQKRINKEVKQREVLRAENNELRSRLDGIENRMQTQTQESEVNILANRINNATSIKQKLLEDAEYEQVAKVDNDIMQMKIHQAKLEERAQQQQYQNENPQQYQQPVQKQAEVPSMQAKWIQNNNRFGKDTAYTQYVNSTYDQMLEDGYDPERGDMYRELNKRLGEDIGYGEDVEEELTSQAKSEVKAKAKPKTRPQSAPTPNVVQAQKKSKSRGITEADKTNMRNWGLDPSNAAVRKEWLQNKKGR